MAIADIGLSYGLRGNPNGKAAIERSGTVIGHVESFAQFERFIAGLLQGMTESVALAAAQAVLAIDAEDGEGR